MYDILDPQLCIAPIAIAGIISAISSIVGSVVTSISSNRSSKNRQKEAFDFNSEEAQINREFQSAEAQTARQWQEDFYTQYQSPQAQVRQYQEAGLNPALMYGHGVSSVVASGASNGPSGSQASGSALNPVGVDSMLSALSTLAKLPSEMELMKAQADDYNASAEGKSIQNAYSEPLLQQELSKGELSIANSQAALVTASAQWQVMDSEAQLNYVRSHLTDAQIKDVLASADLKTKQAATEVVRRSNLEVTNELVACQIVSEQMRPALLAAQTFVANQQGNSFSLDNFQKSIQNRLSQLSGISVGKSWPELLFNVTAEASRLIDVGLGHGINYVKSLFKKK